MRIDRPWLLILLGFSLLANLFLGGIMLGELLGSHQGLGAGAFAPGRQVRLLSPEDRAHFVQAMAPYRAQLRADRQVVRRARAQTEADIASPTYDGIKVAGDFTALRQATASQQALMHRALTNALGHLSPSSRRILVTHVGGVGKAADAR